MQSTGNDEPIPFSRVGDSGRIGLDRAPGCRAFPIASALRASGFMAWAFRQVT
jgi:hypothetical protein